MGRHAKTQRIIDQAHEILAAYNPMTVRQVYYQLVSRQIIENSRSRYQAVCDALVDARLEGAISWDWIEDRLRRPRSIPMWSNLADFAFEMRWRYNRDVWATQPQRVELWLEKDALSGVFGGVVGHYGVMLNVGRGYDGWSSIHNAAERWGAGRDIIVLYFGDHDPSGEDMFRSLRERLAKLNCYPSMLKVALTREDIDRYNLPADFTKATDTRQKAFVAEHGDQAVELDALPTEVLRARIVDEIETRMDLEALAKVHELEDQERKQLVEVLRALS